MYSVKYITETRVCGCTPYMMHGWCMVETMEQPNRPCLSHDHADVGKTLCLPQCVYVMVYIASM